MATYNTVEHADLLDLYIRRNTLTGDNLIIGCLMNFKDGTKLEISDATYDSTANTMSLEFVNGDTREFLTKQKYLVDVPDTSGFVKNIPNKMRKDTKRK